MKTMISKVSLGLSLLVAVLFAACSDNYPKIAGEIRPGEIWPDNNGDHINAHGGGLMYYDGTYYWFGENKGERSSAALVGVMCYSSKDLKNWKNEGVALPVSEDPESEITKGCVLERPKVIMKKPKSL